MSSPPYHLVLLAGGRGTRFWPASRAARPKQFLSLGGAPSLLRQTYERFREQAGSRRGETWVVAPPEYVPLVRRELPELPPGRILEEPSARDTGPAVGLACLAVQRGDPRGLVVVSPADHRIGDPAAFRAALEAALDRAAQGGLGTLGVRPTRPETGFGYLETEAPAQAGQPVPVTRFVEKPDAGAAQRYLAGGRHLWNAGLFVFRVDAFFDEASRVAPALDTGLRALESARDGGDAPAARAAWDSLPKLSFDYSVMERAGDVWTVPLDAGWDDMGNWDAVGRLLPRDAQGNAGSPDQGMFLDSRACTLVDAGNGRAVPLTVLVGVEGLTIVQAGDVTLVCRSERAGDVKQVVERLQAGGRGNLL